MRYAVLGDVLANRFALDAVIETAAKREVDAFLLLGNVVGYGPDPVACMERLLALREKGQLAWVAGRHERFLRGDPMSSSLNREAACTLEWTRLQLQRNVSMWHLIRGVHLTAEINGMIWLVNDSLASPGQGTPRQGGAAVERELFALREDGGVVCFHGATHVMRVDMLRGGRRLVTEAVHPHQGEGNALNPIRFETDDIGWVGAGSVGLPVHTPGVADYLILDDTEWTLECLGAPFSRDEARRRTIEVLTDPCGVAMAERIARWL